MLHSGDETAGDWVAARNSALTGEVSSKIGISIYGYGRGMQHLSDLHRILKSSACSGNDEASNGAVQKTGYDRVALITDAIGTVARNN